MLNPALLGKLGQAQDTSQKLGLLHCKMGIELWLFSAQATVGAEMWTPSQHPLQSLLKGALGRAAPVGQSCPGCPLLAGGGWAGCGMSVGQREGTRGQPCAPSKDNECSPG